MTNWGSTAWSRERIARGLCGKCKNPLSPRSKWWCEEHIEKRRLDSLRRYKENPKLMSHRTKLSGHRTRVRVMVKLGGLHCAWCGERDYRVLSIDHINGHDRPVSERTRSRSGLTTKDLYDIDRGDVELSSFRILCMNCQMRNEHVRGKRTMYPEIIQAVIEAGGAVGEGQNGVTPPTSRS